MSSDVVLDISGVELGGNVGSLAPLGMSSDVVLDISGVALGGNVGSLAPLGMSSEVPVPAVALTKCRGTESRKVIAGNMKIIKMTPICEEKFRLTTHYTYPYCFRLYSKVDKLVVFFEK
jgi:hypothetical protein